MVAERRPVAATPLCNLSVTESLRLRRRQGRASYLVDLFTERRARGAATTQMAEERPAERGAPKAARPA